MHPGKRRSTSRFGRSQDRPAVVLPEWVELPSGLVVRGDAAATLIPQRVAAPADLMPPPRFSPVVNEPPSSLDQFHAFVDEETVGLPYSTLDDIRGRLSEVGFEIGVYALAAVAASVQPGARDLSDEIEMAGRFYSEAWLAQRLQEAARTRGVHLFAEQHFFMLLRLLVLDADDRPLHAGFHSDDESRSLERAFLGMSALTQSDADADLDDHDHWLRLVIRNAAYNVSEPLLEGVTRAHTIFTQIARRPELRDHQDYVPLDEWAQRSGLTIEQQFAAGYVALAASRILDDKAPAGDRGLVKIEPLIGCAQTMGVDPERVRDLLTADRDWYRAQFDPDDHDDMVWNRMPFEQRPLVQLSEQPMLILAAPRAITSWLSDGFYYRALTTAQDERKLGKFTRFFGVLIEHYVADLVAAVHPGPRPPGGGVVHREQRYGNDCYTPDVAIDFGEDLVLIEIVSSRLTAATRIRGSQVEADLHKMLVDKACQLSDRIDDLVTTEAAIPDVDMRLVKRVWPVLVTPAGLIENGLLWDHLDERIAGHLDQARVRPLTLLDFSDLERLAGLVEAGYSIPALLRDKTSGPFGRIDFRRFVTDHLREDEIRRPRILVERWQEAVDQIAAILGYDVEERQRLRAADEPEHPGGD
jgi:hypothetical protein